MVSVIIPAYNCEKTIGQCLKALAQQSYPPDSYEVIVVDDGSADKTASVIKDHPVKYIHQENQGPAAARNNGAVHANGSIILFTDSDCIPDVDWISRMVASFDEPEVMAVKGAYRTMQKPLVARFAQVEFEERFKMLKKAESIDMVDTYSAGFRRDVFMDMGGFDTSFPVANNEDTELAYRMAARDYKMVFNPGAIVYHLNHPDSIARYARLKFWRGYWRMVVYKRFPGKMLKDTYTPKTLKLQVLFLYLTLGLCLPAVFLNLLLYPLALSLIVFVLLTLPFTAFALKRDFGVGLLSPLLLLIRAASLGAGMIWSVIHRDAR